VHPEQCAVAVVDVEQQAIGQDLDALGEALDDAGGRLVPARSEPQRSIHERG
jgi:hypothetical protein